MHGFIGKFSLLCLAVSFLCGCSSVENAHRQKMDMMKAYEEGDNGATLEEIDYKLREPRWYNSSVVNTGDEVMWRLESGSMNFHLGKFDASIRQFAVAEHLIREYDDRAKISVRDVGAEAGTAVTNLNTLPYRGFCRDRIALAVYKSLAYLGNDNERKLLIQDVIDKEPDVVFVAMGSPKQELLMQEMLKAYPAIYQGLGGSFDVYVGNVKRAPKVFCKLGLEWFYRLLMQPTRIKRQLVYVKFMVYYYLNKL